MQEGDETIQMFADRRGTAQRGQLAGHLEQRNGGRQRPRPQAATTIVLMPTIHEQFERVELAEIRRLTERSIEGNYGPRVERLASRRKAEVRRPEHANGWHTRKTGTDKGK